MDPTQGLSSGAVDKIESSPIIDSCPGCGEAPGRLPVVATTLLDGLGLRRCMRCGVRYAAGQGSASARPVLRCETCCLPFVSDRPPSPEKLSCPTCSDGRFEIDLPGAGVIAATEAEVVRALAERWTFVTSEKLQDYLGRVCRQVAGEIDGAPRNSRVIVFEDAVVRTLALPSGTLLVSTGTLGALEDEAALAFVLGHELAHVASADAGAALVRSSLRSVARGERDETPAAWAAAAGDLIKLGHGLRREHDADVCSLCAVVRQGYDPLAVKYLLRRLEEREREGEPELAELALAHPPAAVRLRRIEHAWSDLPQQAGTRTNREVFRRAAGHSVLSSELAPVRPFDTGADDAQSGARARKGNKLLWTALGIAALATIFLLFTLL